MKVNAIQSTDGLGNQTSVSAPGQQEEFSSYLKTSASLEEIFTEASQKYNVPKNLIKAIAKAESDFRPNATSGAGAQGIMQLMPGTARELGVTDAYDPYQNIMGGTKYISQMLENIMVISALPLPLTMQEVIMWQNMEEFHPLKKLRITW